MMYLPKRWHFLRRYIMTRLSKLSHSVYECKYHIVFTPKYRFKILRGDVEAFVRAEIYKLCSYKDMVEIIELNVQEDHVHLLISIPPKYCISDFMGYLKGKLAVRLFNKFERLGKRFWGRHFWAKGYCLTTVGLDEENIRKYVKYQEKQEKESK